MKAIPYVLAIIVAGGAAFFSISLSGKFEELQNIRLSTIAQNKEVTAKAEAADKNIKDEKALLVASQDKKEVQRMPVKLFGMISSQWPKNWTNVKRRKKNQKN